MKLLFCKIRNKSLVIMLIMLLIISCSLQIFAAYTDKIKSGDTLKFTGTAWTIYKTESAAKNMDSSKIKRYLSKNQTVTVQSIKENVLKIGNNEYIYYGSTGSKYFSNITVRNNTTSSSSTVNNTTTTNRNSNTATSTTTTNHNSNTSATTSNKTKTNDFLNKINSFRNSISTNKAKTNAPKVDFSNVSISKPDSNSDGFSFFKLLSNLFSNDKPSNNNKSNNLNNNQTITIPSEKGPGYNFHYNNLTAKEQQVYRFMYSKKSDLIDGKDINLLPLSTTLNGVTFDEFFNAMHALELDQPEFYYIKTYNKYVLSKSTAHLVKYSCNSKSSSLKQNLEKINSIVNNVISNAKTKSTDYAKLKYLHDWIANNLTYKTQISYSLDGFLTKKGQCCTYAFMYQYMLNKLDIDCIYVTGNVPDGLHAWNQVKLNNKWYGIDICWDDPNNYALNYKYFLKGKNNFMKNRTTTPTYPYPTLTNSNY